MVDISASSFNVFNVTCSKGFLCVEESFNFPTVWLCVSVPSDFAYLWLGLALKIVKECFSLQILNLQCFLFCSSTSWIVEPTPVHERIYRCRTLLEGDLELALLRKEEKALQVNSGCLCVARVQFL